SGALIHLLAFGVRGLLHALLDLSRAAAAATADESRRPALPSLTGVVWDACGQLLTTPMNNKLAARREMLQWSLNVKDTIGEFSAALAASGGGEGGGEKAGDESCGGGASSCSGTAGAPNDADLDNVGDEDGLGGDDDDDVAYSPAEAACAEAALHLLRLARRCIKAGNDALHALPDVEGDMEGVEWAGEVHAALGVLHSASGELGTELYAPVDGTAAGAAVAVFTAAATSFLDVL
ncbi:unnamed protein product, partial [Phaeothamnion confervicola]